MKRPLYIAGGGAVTAAGLDFRQTLAAIRANLTAIEVQGFFDLGLSQAVSRIPAHHELRKTHAAWLINMAARAINEALASGDIAAEDTVLLFTPPESFRNHPLYDGIQPSALLASLTGEIGKRFHPSSRALDGGAAAGIGLIGRVEELLASQAAHQVILGGMDSFLNERDLARLSAAGRLKGQENSQGLVPGEGAVFVRLTREPDVKSALSAAIPGFGLASERDTVLSERHSQGRAVVDALTATISEAGASEADVGFVVSNSNGERYSGWEQMICHPRFYRTRRDKLSIAYPAMTVGDIGAASGALTLLVAADSLSKGYAPNTVAMCEVASEGGLRAAALVRLPSLS